jgi:hypothetical protein
MLQERNVPSASSFDGGQWAAGRKRVFDATGELGNKAMVSLLRLPFRKAIQSIAIILND